MILSVQHLSKSFGIEPVLCDVSFHLEDREKAALVGINGAGKSTLLKILVGEMEADSGSVTFAKDKTFGYLAQYQEAFGDRTVLEEVLEGKRDLVEMEREIRSMETQMQSLPEEEAIPFLERYHRLLQAFEASNGYAFRSEVSGVLKGLGFFEEDFGRHCGELSGGQKTRVALARLLAVQPDLLLLDEPTNHLDLASIRWLETFLLNYRGAVLVVSHDRYFLDRIATKVVELSHHHAVVYSGNYTDYAQLARQKREAAERAYLNQQREIRRQQEVIDRLRSFNREKSVRRAQSREKMLEKMEPAERLAKEDPGMRLSFAPAVPSGKDVLAVEGLAKSYGNKFLFSDLSFELRRGEHVALIGENGVGKTTILKILNRMIEADDGFFRLGTNVVIGYYDQEQQALHPEKTVYDEIADDRPDLTQTAVRSLLAAFLFPGDDVFCPVADLSGGERGRLSLAKLMLSEANFLILDEPTNHLDIVSREVLESALNCYEGTVLFVSHDRYFINRCAKRILELEDGRLTNYPGNYDYYLEKKESFSNPAEQETDTLHPNSGSRDIAGTDLSSGKADWLSQKEEQARERKRLNRIARTEEEISEYEARIAEIDAAFADPAVATDPARLADLNAEQTGIRKKLEALYEEWEKLSEN